RAFPPIMAARIGATGADPELSFRSDRISILYIPDDAAQTKLAGDMTSPASPLAIDGTLPGCRPASACDFTAGADVLIYEPVGAGGAHEVLSVSSVDAATNTLTPSAPLSRSYS